MSKQVFINFATDDLERSSAFYVALGCEINPLFSNEQGVCAVWSEHIYFMLLTREYFGTFTEKKVPDARRVAQVLVALAQGSRDEVDATVTAGLAAGGAEPAPAQDLGFMYSRDLEDPDGNIVELFFMDPAAVESGPPDMP
ncbi:VOC family protein [Leucobacter sp. HY1908]